jgi:hypothetical protein
MDENTNPGLISAMRRLKSENQRLRDQVLLRDSQISILQIEKPKDPLYQFKRQAYYDGFRSGLMATNMHHYGCTNVGDVLAWDNGYKDACSMVRSGAIEYIAQYAQWKAGQEAFKREVSRWHKWDALQAERLLLRRRDPAALCRRRDKQRTDHNDITSP